MAVQISVVIPTLNEANTISQCLDAVAPQGPAETLVVDGGSDDETAAIAESRGATVVTAPRGRARQLNAGAALSRSQVLLFLHADCRLPPDGLRQIQQCVEQGGAAGSFRHRIESPRRAYRVIEWGDHLRQRWLRAPYGDQALFVRRELFESLGRFPDVPLMEDLRFVRQLRRAVRLRVLPGPLTTSPRRWERRGLLRQFLLNQYLLIAERLGVPLEKLAELYYGRPASED